MLREASPFREHQFELGSLAPNAMEILVGFALDHRPAVRIFSIISLLIRILTTAAAGEMRWRNPLKPRDEISC
jgi:hypothetical protein